MSSAVNIRDLNPREASFTLAGKAYELKPFTLAAQVWAYDEFKTESQPNGLEGLSERMKVLEPAAIAKVAYYLLKDKSDFPNVDKFIDRLGDHYTTLSILIKPISEVIGISQPEITEDELELKK